MATEAQAERPRAPAQITIDTYDGSIPRPTLSSTLTFAKMREMAEHPIISYPLAFSIAPILAANWAVEGESDEAVQFITDELIPHRDEFLASALWALKVFGWGVYEIVYNTDQTLHGINQLKNDCTQARRDVHTAEYLGLKTTNHNAVVVTGDIYIDALHSLFVSFPAEALGGYGISRMKGIEGLYDAYLDLEETEARWTKKVAGGLWHIKFPTGQTWYNDTETDNAVIAEDVAKAIKGSGVAITPSQPMDMGNGKIVNAWEIERIDATGASADFLTSRKQIEALCARQLLVGERAIVEAQLAGSRADSESATDVSLLCMELTHKQTTEFLNKHLVDRLLTIHHGEPGLAKLCAQPLQDDQKAMYKELITLFIQDPALGPELMESLDMNAIVDTLGLPVTQDIAVPTVEDREAKAEEAFEQQKELKGNEGPPE